LYKNKYNSYLKYEAKYEAKYRAKKYGAKKIFNERGGQNIGGKILVQNK
jgi:hypothetical protein